MLRRTRRLVIMGSDAHDLPRKEGGREGGRVVFVSQVVLLSVANGGEAPCYSGLGD